MIKHNREDKLVDEIRDLQRQVRELKATLERERESAYGNEEAARAHWESEARERGKWGIYG